MFVKGIRTRGTLSSPVVTDSGDRATMTEGNTVEENRRSQLESVESTNFTIITVNKPCQRSTSFFWLAIYNVPRSYRSASVREKQTHRQSSSSNSEATVM